MKKLLIGLMMLGMVSTAQASPLKFEDAIKKIVEKVPMKQGMAYSFVDDKFNFISTLEVANWKGATAEFGYAGSASESGHKLVGVISYPILKLKDYIDVPVLNLIEANIGAYGGLGKIQFGGDVSNDNLWDMGVSLTLMEIKF